MSRRAAEQPPANEGDGQPAGMDDVGVNTKGVSLVDFSKVARRDLWLVFDQAGIEVARIAKGTADDAPWKVEIGTTGPVAMEFTSAVAARCFVLGYFHGREAAAPQS
jgi:hypothetical protein